MGIGKHFWLNIVLTLLGYFPGVIHAIYIIVLCGGFVMLQTELDFSPVSVRM